MAMMGSMAMASVGAGSVSLRRGRSCTVCSAQDPILVQCVKGVEVERPPTWMMRQAGRTMKAYRELVKQYPTFKERSERPEVAAEISLQPFHAYKPDGVVLFSDILTPLAGMNIPHAIVTGRGPVFDNPYQSAADIEAITALTPEESMSFVGETLRMLRAEVGDKAAVLGFVGAPFTLACYMVEGEKSSTYIKVKEMAFQRPELLRALLEKLTDAMVVYMRYQADCGAQAVQIFDSWGSKLTPSDWDAFSRPYLDRMVREFKATHPGVPVIMFAQGSGALLERFGTLGVDVTSVCWSVDMLDARKRLPEGMAVQGNMDPVHMHGTRDFISAKVVDTITKAGPKGHIMNLGHGVRPGATEENIAHWFEQALSFRYKDHGML